MKVKIHLADETKQITIDDSLCKTDEMLRDQLTPYYQGIGEAEIRRDRTKGIIWVDTVAGAFAAEDLDDLLAGRQLLVAFTWVPSVKGKVQVTVNATNLPAEAERKLISADVVPKMPKDVLVMITEALAKTEKKPKAKAKAAGGKK